MNEGGWEKDCERPRERMLVSLGGREIASVCVCV